jgi:hypothetical protein
VEFLDTVRSVGFSLARVSSGMRFTSSMVPVGAFMVASSSIELDER